MGTQDCKFTGIIETNQLGFKCLKPRNPTGSNKNLITQMLHGIILRFEEHVHVYSYYKKKNQKTYNLPEKGNV